ncbi:NEDD4-binding protein 1-like isoform X2 [Ostrinia furnacalis]|uniref:NEDD4-binding protein 1-like isoform X2 n=1 Tax=Ostrinia furnacalis TaxID=93504 RepID=UPI00103984F7|nr:NEDD4-binding protein 1-like isoform X2 [Ostrinia furnacalis]
MGKPSTSRLKTKSEESMAKDNPLNALKRKRGARKRVRKSRAQINKLFQMLQKQNNISSDPIEDLSEVWNSTNNTVIVLDDTIKESPRKRKLSESSVIITDVKGLQTNTEPCNSVEKNNIEPKSVETAIDSVIITDNDVPNMNSVSYQSKKKKIEATDTNPIVITDNEVLHDNPEPSSSKTPKKKGFAPPMNCSTPISKSNTSLINNNADSTQNLNNNVTKVINRDSFLTIDLTADSDLSRLQCNTVIDLDNTQDSQDCTLVSISNASSMSGDSQVTVLHKNNSSKRMKKFVSGIAKLDASEKGKLLELITQNIFNGCKEPMRMNRQNTVNQETETAENTYIKEVILGQKKSRNSIGSNIYNPEKDDRNKTGLRMVVIDGSNVAMEHGRGRCFSVKGLKICIDYFLKRGHAVKAFVPRFRCKFGKSSEPRLLDELERRGLVVYTPSREIQGKLITPYDDRYIVQCAAEFDGVIVTGDNYRDLLQENPRWRFVIENRLLPFTWVNDMIMFPRDPLGRNGPTLEQFLRHPVAKTIPSIVL